MTQRLIYLLPYLTLLAFSLTLSVGAAQDAEGETLTLTNVGASAWRVAEADENVAEQGVDNPELMLTVGTRYTFDVSGVNSSVHPLDFRAEDDTVLLSQGSEGELEGDEAIRFEASDEAVSFTLTPELADRLARYHCTVHASMVGNVVTNSEGDTESTTGGAGGEEDAASSGEGETDASEGDEDSSY